MAKKPKSAAEHPLRAYIMGGAAQARRRLSIGGSDANTLMSGDADRIAELWREKRGEGKPQGDPSINMLMGTATEALNAAWYHHKTGDLVTDVQGFVANHEHGYPAHATLDGLCHGGSAIWEAKHTGGYDFAAKGRRTIDTVRALYMPQLQHNMMVCCLNKAVISVFFDNSSWDYCEVEADPFYQEALREAESTFWANVQSGEPPNSIAVIAPPTTVAEYREVDMTGNNAWAVAAADYLRLKPEAEAFEDSVIALRSLVEYDVGTAAGYGVRIRRDKRNAMRIYED